MSLQFCETYTMNVNFLYFSSLGKPGVPQDIVLGHASNVPQIEDLKTLMLADVVSFFIQIYLDLDNVSFNNNFVVISL